MILNKNSIKEAGLISISLFIFRILQSQKIIEFFLPDLKKNEALFFINTYFFRLNIIDVVAPLQLFTIYFICSLIFKNEILKNISFFCFLLISTYFLIQFNDNIIALDVAIYHAIEYTSFIILFNYIFKQYLLVVKISLSMFIAYFTTFVVDDLISNESILKHIDYNSSLFKNKSFYTFITLQIFIYGFMFISGLICHLIFKEKTIKDDFKLLHK